jgi:hypothetical protein
MLPGMSRPLLGALLGLALIGCGARSTLDEASSRPVGSEGSTGAGRRDDGSGGSVGGEPACETLHVAGDGTPSSDVAVDEIHAYWSTFGGSVQRAALETGERETLLEGGGRLPTLALDDASIYVASEEALLRLPKAGGEPEALLVGPLHPLDLAWSDGVLFYLDQVEVPPGQPPTQGTLWTWTRAAGASMIASGLTGRRGELAVDERDVFVLSVNDEAPSTLVRLDRATFTREARTLPAYSESPALTETEIIYARRDRALGTVVVEAASRSGASTRTVTEVDALGNRTTGIAAGLDEVFFALNGSDGYGAMCPRPTAWRAPLAGDPAVALPYDSEDLLIEPAANTTHIAFARYTSCGGGDGIVIYCR